MASRTITHTSSDEVTIVTSVAGLEEAVAAQKAGEFIKVAAGDYTLTEELVPPLAATGGGLILVGGAEITGAASADSAISIVATGATSTFEYTLMGEGSFKGGSNKIGLNLTNPAISQKTILYIKDAVHFEDNGTGEAFNAINTGTGAMRVYVTCKAGTGWDTVAITNKNADDKWHFRGINFDEGLTAAVVAIADNWFFQDCQIAHAGMAGGHASNVVNVVNCFTIETADVAIVDGNENSSAGYGLTNIGTTQAAAVRQTSNKNMSVPGEHPNKAIPFDDKDFSDF